MRYSTVFKFIAIVLCAASLLGMVGSAAGIFFLTELGGKSVEQTYRDQLSSRAVGYAQMAGQAYASEYLGGTPRSLINKYIGNDWENAYFDWTRVGYTLYDGDGNVVQEQPILDDRYKAEYTFDNAVSGLYMKVVETASYEEQPSQITEPIDAEGTKVLVMPSQDVTPIGSIIVDYTDGHREAWDEDEILGHLCREETELIFASNQIGELPMGDNWYPNRVMMTDMGGNVVYEAVSDNMVLLGMEMNGNNLNLHLPAGTVTMAAPVGINYEKDDYTSYDAIPIQGVTVTSMNVTYANAQGEIIGSEGVSSPDLIGTIFHRADGNVQFQSNAPMTIDIPKDCIIAGIIFVDAGKNLIFEANCPDGVGGILYDQNEYLTFYGRMPGTDIPELSQTAETDQPEEKTENPMDGLPGIVLKHADVYSMPNINGQVVDTVEPGQEVLVIIQQAYHSGGENRVWCMIESGWVLMDYVTLVKEELDARAMAEDIPMVTAPTETEEDIPEETIAATEAVIRAIPEKTEDVVPETTEALLPASAETASYSAEDMETGVYYDSGLKQNMIAGYVWEPIPEGYTMTIQLAPGAMRNELGWTLLRLAEVFRSRSILLEILGICIAVFALCIVHLSCSAGRTRRNNEVRAGGLNRIPLDLYLAGGGFGIVGLVAAAVYGSEYFARSDEQLAILFCGACAYTACLLLVSFFFAFVAQVKTPGGFWWRNTLCGHCLRLLVTCGRKVDAVGKKCWTDGRPAAGHFLRWLKRTCTAVWIFMGKAAVWMWDTGKRLMFWLTSLLGKCFRWTTAKFSRFFGMLPITWQFLTTGFTLVVLLYVMMRTYKVGYILLGFGIFFAVILYAASAFAILLENAKRMSKGDLDTQVDDRMLIGGFREFAERLNDLAGVAVIAAQKQLKSERMKTELITNVSHDIKTPLTSIINYVDLLQKPHTQEQQTQYLEVLDRQSQRLKKLIDDLMEMSKASTGNMSVDIDTVDAGEAVNQALGEFADKLERAQLTPVFRQPEEQVLMLADGRLVWRVMSNILGNAVKYALPGTRIYLDLLKMDGKVIISMKNISREELNVHADELMERFVRGDASRNTEGSGLGLNIAQSLMELQKGQLQILVDGDLFKVTLIFPAA